MKKTELNPTATTDATARWNAMSAHEIARAAESDLREVIANLDRIARYADPFWAEVAQKCIFDAIECLWHYDGSVHEEEDDEDDEEEDEEE